MATITLVMTAVASWEAYSCRVEGPKVYVAFATFEHAVIWGFWGRNDCMPVLECNPTDLPVDVCILPTCGHVLFQCELARQTRCNVLQCVERFASFDQLVAIVGVCGARV